jgi:hypothetical protein
MDRLDHRQLAIFSYSSFSSRFPSSTQNSLAKDKTTSLPKGFINNNCAIGINQKDPFFDEADASIKAIMEKRNADLIEQMKYYNNDSSPSGNSIDVSNFPNKGPKKGILVRKASSIPSIQSLSDKSPLGGYEKGVSIPSLAESIETQSTNEQTNSIGRSQELYEYEFNGNSNDTVKGKKSKKVTFVLENGANEVTEEMEQSIRNSLRKQRRLAKKASKSLRSEVIDTLYQETKKELNKIPVKQPSKSLPDIYALSDNITQDKPQVKEKEVSSVETIPNTKLEQKNGKKENDTMPKLNTNMNGTGVINSRPDSKQRTSVGSKPSNVTLPTISTSSPVRKSREVSKK